MPNALRLPSMSRARPSTATVTITTTATTTAALASHYGAIYACALFGCVVFVYFQARPGSRLRNLTCRALVMRRPDRRHLDRMWQWFFQNTVPGTPSGTSTITLTASTTQGGVTVTHNATGSLTVQ